MLANSYTGEVYAWGRGSHGRLGLGDYNDRWKPCLIRSLKSLKATIIGAGSCHSLTVCEAQDGEQHVYCWGKGASGRLGYGRSNNCKRPMLLETFPPSIKEYRITTAALGGSHTMVLCSKEVGVSLGNPWAFVSRIYSWGSGAAGQLGNDRTLDCSIPQKVLVPEWELIVSISAGKLTSTAITVYGELYAWGSNFSGELGTGDVDFRYKPTKLNSNKVWLKVAGGDHHAFGLALKGRIFSRRQIEKKKLFYEEPNHYLGLARRESKAVELWDCARRATVNRSLYPSNVGFACATCNFAMVCRSCSMTCHRGHDLRLLDLSYQTLCTCGLSSKTCKLLSVIPEEREDGRELFAITLQRLARGHRVRQGRREDRKRFLIMRRKICGQLWHQQIIKPIMERVRVVKEEWSMKTENICMAQAEVESYQASKYLKLQKTLQILDAQQKALHQYLTKGRCWPSPGLVTPSIPVPSTYYTRYQLQQFIRGLPYSARPRPEHIVRLTKGLPVFGDLNVAKNMTVDPDIATLIQSTRGDISVNEKRASIAGTEGLYRRLRKFEVQRKSKHNAVRRQSFSIEADMSKTGYPEASKSDEDMKRRILEVDRSLELSRAVALDPELTNRLSSIMYLSSPEGSREYRQLIQEYASPGLNKDVEQMVTSQRSRRYSFAAPERVYRSVSYWKEGLEQEEAIFEAAARETLPCRRASWTWRLDKVGSEKRALVFESKDWDKDSERLALVAESRGWDLKKYVQELEAERNPGNPADIEDGIEPPWQVFQDENGYAYKYNPETGESEYLCSSEGSFGEGVYGGDRGYGDGTMTDGTTQGESQYTTAKYLDQSTSQSQSNTGSKAAAGEYAHSAGLPYSAYGKDYSSYQKYEQLKSPLFQPASTQSVYNNSRSKGIAFQDSERQPAESYGNISNGGCINAGSAVEAAGRGGSDWASYQDENGNWYWYNNITGESQWA